AQGASCADRLLSPIVFTTPARLVEPDPWVGHLPFAYWLVSAMRPQSVVELGTHTGNSYSAFVHAVEITGLSTSASCVAIDTWSGDPQSGYYGDEVFQEWSRFHDQRFGRFSRL